MHVKQEEAIVGFDHADHARGNDPKPPNALPPRVQLRYPRKPTPGSLVRKLNRSDKVEQHRVPERTRTRLTMRQKSDEFPSCFGLWVPTAFLTSNF